MSVNWSRDDCLNHVPSRVAGGLTDYDMDCQYNFIQLQADDIIESLVLPRSWTLKMKDGWTTIQDSKDDNIGKDPRRSTGQHLVWNLTRPEGITALQGHGGTIRKGNNGRKIQRSYSHNPHKHSYITDWSHIQHEEVKITIFTGHCNLWSTKEVPTQLKWKWLCLKSKIDSGIPTDSDLRPLCLLDCLRKL